MDPSLVEEITRLVIQKLEERSVSTPLTNEEIKDWNSITSSMKEATTTEVSLLKREFEIIPLTEKEIATWNRITSSMKRTASLASEENSEEKGRVKIFQYY